jgi:hypothetical protein
MPRKFDKKIAAAIAGAAIVIGGAGGYLLLSPEPSDGEHLFSIASWNLEIFGPTKGGNEPLLDYYSDKLDEYDLFIVQEIRDIAGEAIVNLAEKLPEYEYILSQRAGRSNNKEQIAVFYNDRATLNGQYDWTDEMQDEFERPPFRATFTVESWTFTLYTIHVKPDDAPNELSYLEDVVGEPEGDTIILGDLNADGSYYDEDNIEHFVDWQWVITNDMDTTEASSDNTYDRIIINDAVENNFVQAGVMDDVEPEQSDHYLVYGEFDPDESSKEPPEEPTGEHILINEFEQNPEGTDSGNEWVELFNPTDGSIDLTGWSLRNNDGDIHSLSGSIDPNGYEVITFSGGWLDNSDERVILLNPSYQEIDVTPIEGDSSNDDRSWQRIPNGADTDSESDWAFLLNTQGYSNTE